MLDDSIVYIHLVILLLILGFCPCIMKIIININIVVRILFVGGVMSLDACLIIIIKKRIIVEVIFDLISIVVVIIPEKSCRRHSPPHDDSTPLHNLLRI